MILIGVIIYFVLASLFVASLALAAARPMPTPRIDSDASVEFPQGTIAIPDRLHPVTLANRNLGFSHAPH